VTTTEASAIFGYLMAEDHHLRPSRKRKDGRRLFDNGKRPKIVIATPEPPSGPRRHVPDLLTTKLGAGVNPCDATVAQQRFIQAVTDLNGCWDNCRRLLQKCSATAWRAYSPDVRAEVTETSGARPVIIAAERFVRSHLTRVKDRPLTAS